MERRLRNPLKPITELGLNYEKVCKNCEYSPDMPGRLVCTKDMIEVDEDHTCNDFELYK